MTAWKLHYNYRESEVVSESDLHVLALQHGNYDIPTQVWYL